MEFFQDPSTSLEIPIKLQTFFWCYRTPHPQEIPIPSVRRVWIFPELHNFITCHLDIAEEEWSNRTNPLLFHAINMSSKLFFYIFAVDKMTLPLKNTFFQFTANTWNSSFFHSRLFIFCNQVPFYFVNYILSSIALSLSALFFLNSLLSGLFSGFRQAFNFCSKLFICSLLAVDFAWPLTKVAMFSIWLRTCC